MAKSKRERQPSNKEPPPMRVKELMTHSPRACGVNDSANAAARIMWERDCGAVPVLGDDGHVVGIVTDRDICMAAYFQGLPLSSIQVANIMSADVCTCEAHDEVTRAEALMRQRQINRLPVVENGGMLVGMLSLCDVTQGIKRAGGDRKTRKVDGAGMPQRAGVKLVTDDQALDRGCGRHQPEPGVRRDGADGRLAVQRLANDSARK